MNTGQQNQRYLNRDSNKTAGLLPSGAAPEEETLLFNRMQQRRQPDSETLFNRGLPLSVRQTGAAPRRVLSEGLIQAAPDEGENSLRLPSDKEGRRELTAPEAAAGSEDTPEVSQWGAYGKRAMDPGLRPDGRPQGYGCGDKNTDALVPDRFLKANFLGSCRAHDLCYERPGATQGACDATFNKDLLAACDKLDGFHRLYKPLCKGVAHLYTASVGAMGGSAFKAAQAETQQDATREHQMLNLLEKRGIPVDRRYYDEVKRQSALTSERP